MVALHRLLAATVIFCVLCLVVSIEFSSVAAARAEALPRASDVHVDLFRGLANIFSRGLDTLADRLNRQGYTARVFPHRSWRTVAQRITAERARGQRHVIVLIGHSLGANAILQLAQELQRSQVPIALVVTYDATNPRQVPNNVQHVVNFFQHNGIGRPVTAMPGFKGRLENIDLTTDRSLTHWNIEESSRLHDQIIARIMQIVNQDMAGKVQPAGHGNRSRGR